MNAKILLVFAPFGVKNIPLCAIKKRACQLLSLDYALKMGEFVLTVS